MAYIKLLNLFGRKKPAATTAKLPHGIPAPEPQGYASQVAVASEPQSQAATVREMDKDYQVAFFRKIIAANISAIKVSVSAEGGDADPRTKAVVDSLEALWKDSVGAMQDAIGQGRRAFEKTPDYDPAARVNTIRKLEPLEPEDSRLKLNPDGTFAGIEIKLHDDQWETIPVSNSWWLALEPTAKYPHGRSRYFPSMNEAWKQKKKVVDLLEKFIRRFVVRGGVAHIPFTEINPEDGRIINTADKFAEALECLYSGGTAALPNDLHSGDPTKYKYDYTGDVSTLDPAPLLNVIEKWDVAILRAGGVPEKTVTEGSAVGSFAMVSQQMLTLFATVESILNEMVKSFQRYVADAVVEMNWGEGAGPKITVTFPSLTNRPDSFVAEVLKLLFANPGFQQAIIEGGVDLRQMLTAAGIPLVDGFEEIVASVAQRVAATQQAGVMAPAVGMGGDQAAVGGEFGSLSTLQWRRNIKAIREALNDFATGLASEVMTLQLLESLGLSPERAKVLMEDARDGTVDDPELTEAGMANTAKPRGLGLAVPTQEALISESMAEFDSLFDRLIAALAKQDYAKVREVREEIVRLETDIRIASRALGMLSLWSPSINTYADGAAKQVQTAIRMANEGPAYRFPWLKTAVDWLAEKGIVTASEFAKRSAADKRTVLSVPGVESVRTLKKIRTKLADALEKGTDLREFRKSIAEDVALQRSQTETLYRTNMKQGYVAGLDNALSVPAVQDEFPYVIFRATPDTRVRDDHWDLDGFVCLRSDPAYKVLKAALTDWNCRCGMAPLSEKQAANYTIKTYADLPADVVAKYG